jgi:SecDF, P1 head subdomain
MQSTCEQDSINYNKQYNTMKTLKYILLGVILSSLVFSSFSIFTSKKSGLKSSSVTFCETYTQREILSGLDKGDRFFKLVNMENTNPGSSKIGRCREADWNDLQNYTLGESFRSEVPMDLIIAAGDRIEGHMISLYAIRENGSTGVIPTGADLEEVSVSSSDDGENYMLLFSFSKSGAEKWASMTRRNIGKDIAILRQGKVIAAPRVQEEIKDGKCAISGSYTESEINSLKAEFEN